MANPNAIFTELTVTTFQNHNADIMDNVSRNNALYRQIVTDGNYELEDGGTELVENLEYGENNTYQRYSGFDKLQVTESEILTAANFPWRNIALNVVASGSELRSNSGQFMIVKLAKVKIKNAIKTFKNNFSYDMYSDGTLTNQIGGLQALVSDAGTGTVGGIDSSTYLWWQSLVQSAATPRQGGGAITPSSTTIENGLMLPLYMDTTRGDDQTNLIVSSNDYYQFFEASQTSLKRYTGSGEATGGFISLMYKKAKVIFDGGSGIPNSHMYFLNTDYIKLRVHRAANLSVLESAKPYDQDAAVIPVLWMGNMTCSNRSLQGVVKV